ncbi:hypothetical protein L249_2513, partial [Ophiocordyceps polyrhachis-furcata BCC 54312]
RDVFVFCFFFFFVIFSSPSASFSVTGDDGASVRSSLRFISDVVFRNRLMRRKRFCMTSAGNVRAERQTRLFLLVVFITIYLFKNSLRVFIKVHVIIIILFKPSTFTPQESQSKVKKKKNLPEMRPPLLAFTATAYIRFISLAACLPFVGASPLISPPTYPVPDKLPGFVSGSDEMGVLHQQLRNSARAKAQAQASKASCVATGVAQAHPPPPPPPPPPAAAPSSTAATTTTASCCCSVASTGFLCPISISSASSASASTFTSGSRLLSKSPSAGRSPSSSAFGPAAAASTLSGRHLHRGGMTSYGSSHIFADSDLAIILRRKSLVRRRRFSVKEAIARRHVLLCTLYRPVYSFSAFLSFPFISCRSFMCLPIQATQSKGPTLENQKQEVNAFNIHIIVIVYFDFFFLLLLLLLLLIIIPWSKHIGIVPPLYPPPPPPCNKPPASTLWLPPAPPVPAVTVPNLQRRLKTPDPFSHSAPLPSHLLYLDMLSRSMVKPAYP